MCRDYGMNGANSTPNTTEGLGQLEKYEMLSGGLDPGNPPENPAEIRRFGLSFDQVVDEID